VFPAPLEGMATPELSERLERGWRYLQADNLRGAEREFAEAQKGAPAASPVETALGYVELARKDTKDAVVRFDRALQSSERYVPALVGRGQALLALGRDGDALASFETALAVQPVAGLRERVDVLRFRAVQDNLQRAKAATDAGRWDDARAAYQQALAASPESSFLYRDLASLERRAGQSAPALEHARKAVSLDDSDAVSHALLGELLDEQGDSAGALAAVERARAIDPGSVSDATWTRVREHAALSRLPEEFRAISAAPAISRGDLAALLGVRLQSVLTSVRQRQVVITDIRGHWAQEWIVAVTRAGVMEPLPNYTFRPDSPMTRADFAQVMNRALTLVSARRPELAAKWQGARLQVSDVPPSHLAYPAVSAAVASGVLGLDPDGRFNLLRPVTGAEANAAVARLETLLAPASPKPGGEAGLAVPKLEDDGRLASPKPKGAGR
jgi:tetratricopeptide (TPR) repeat protein